MYEGCKKKITKVEKEEEDSNRKGEREKYTLKVVPRWI